MKKEKKQCPYYNKKRCPLLDGLMGAKKFCEQFYCSPEPVSKMKFKKRGKHENQGKGENR